MKRILLSFMVLGLASVARAGFGDVGPTAKGFGEPAVQVKDASAPTVVTSTPTPTPTLEQLIPSVMNLLADPAKEFKFLKDDLVHNTGFKVDSAIPFMAFDWRTGKTSGGAAVPFLHEGSYLYTAGAIAKNTSGSGPLITNAEAFEGIRLNDLTRPAIYWILNQMTFHQLDKNPLLAAVAGGSSVGVAGGHDFNDPTAKKVIINSEQIFFGLEVTVGTGGGTSSLVSAQSVGQNHLAGPHKNDWILGIR